MQILSEHSQALLRKYPEPIVIGIVKKEKNIYNPITLGWFMITSFQPLLFAVSIGKTRYSLELFRKQKEWVISFPSVEMKEAALFYGSNSGKKINKIDAYPLSYSAAEKIDSIIFQDAAANFECVYHSEHQTGDHVILVGEIINSFENENNKIQRLLSIGKGHILGSAEDYLSIR